MSLKNLFSLEDRVAIVTGGGRGNGKSIAKALVASGAIVYLIDMLKSELDLTVHQLGDKCHGIYVDVTDYKKMGDAIGKIYETHGRLDILFNNAGISQSSPSEDYPENSWVKTLEVNLTAPFRLATLAFPFMVKTNGGVIINITSICSELGASENPSYVSSKGGLKMLTRALAKDWAKFNIRVNNLGLGYFQTSMTSKSFQNPALNQERASRTMLNRWGDEQDIAGPAIFLASDASGYITGQDVYVDGGFLANGI